MFFRLLFVVILLPTTISEIKQLSLTSKTSSIYYKPFTWHVTDPLRLIIKFETNNTGRILTLLAKNKTHEVAYALAIDIMSGGVVEVYQQLKPLVTVTDRNPTINITDGTVHTQKLIFENLTMTDALDDKSKSTQHLDFRPDQTFEITLIFGQYLGNKSIIGCIESNIASVDRVEPFQINNKTQVDFGTPCYTKSLTCQNGGVCKEVSNGGVCKEVSLLQSACDCYGTDFEGETCSEESGIAVFNGSSFKRFAYILRQSDHPERISFDFKLNPADHAAEQYFAHARVWFKTSETSASSGTMNVYYDGNSKLVFLLFDSNKVKEEFLFDPKHKQWHSFSLTIDYKERLMVLTFDNQKKQLTSLENWRFEDLFLGGQTGNIHFSRKYASEYGKGFSGCLKNVYVDHISMFDMIKKGNKRVVHSENFDFGNCQISVSARSVFSTSLFVIIFLFSL